MLVGSPYPLPKREEDPKPSLIESSNELGKEAASKSLAGRGLMLATRHASLGMRRNREEKAILKGISLYFNPGEMIGIMGPSGEVEGWGSL